MPYEPRFRSRRKRIGGGGETTDSAVSKILSFDLLLQRGSALAQIAMSVITVGTIYFTVVPLYQKSILEEAVAKKEVELREVTEKFERSYGRVRALAVGEYVQRAGPDCMGLLRPPVSIGMAPTQDDEEGALAIDAQECLLRNLSSSPSLKDLRSDDLDKFTKVVSDLGRRLNAERGDALSRFKKLPMVMTEEISRGIELKGAMGAWEAYVQSVVQAGIEIPGTAARRHQAVIWQAQGAITRDYARLVQREIIALRETKW